MPCFVDIKGAGKEENTMQLAWQKKKRWWLWFAKTVFVFAQTKAKAETRAQRITMSSSASKKSEHHGDSMPAPVPVPLWRWGKAKWSHWQNSAIKNRQTNKMQEPLSLSCLQEKRQNRLTDCCSKNTRWEGFIAQPGRICDLVEKRSKTSLIFSTQLAGQQPLVKQLQVNRDLLVSVYEQMMEFKKR